MKTIRDLLSSKKFLVAGGRWQGYCDPMHFEFVGKSTAQV